MQRGLGLFLALFPPALVGSGHQSDSPVRSLQTAAAHCRQCEWCQFPESMTPWLESPFDPMAPIPQLLIRPTPASVPVRVILQLGSQVKLCIARGNSALAVVAIFDEQVFPPLSTGREHAGLLLVLDVTMLSACSLSASTMKGFSLQAPRKGFPCYCESLGAVLAVKPSYFTGVHHPFGSGE